MFLFPTNCLYKKIQNLENKNGDTKFIPMFCINVESGKYEAQRFHDKGVTLGRGDPVR